MNQIGGRMPGELIEIAKSMQAEPATAEGRLRAYLDASPSDANANYLFGICLRLQNKYDEARAIFERLSAEEPNNALLRQDLGLTYFGSGKLIEARDALGEAIKLQPRLPLAWQALSDVLGRLGDSNGSQKAMQQYQVLMAQSQGGQDDTISLQQIRDLMRQGQLQQAERLCRSFLQRHPGDANAMTVLGDIALSMAAFSDAKDVFERTLDLAPDNLLARFGLANAHYRLGNTEEAAHELEIVETAKPDDPNAILLRSKIAFDTARYDEALEGFEHLIENFPKVPTTMIEYGHTLRAMGRKDEAIVAYREAEALRPGFGQAWFALSNLKSGALGPDDIERMKSVLAQPNLNPEDEYQIAFALGGALEDLGDWDGAFEAFQRGNGIQKAMINFNGEPIHKFIDGLKSFYTPAFMQSVKGLGNEHPDPIFIVGMPRSGSTLIEQVLASHSQVDGTFELPDIQQIVTRLDKSGGTDDFSNYPGCMSDLEAEGLSSLGQEYIDQTMQHRGSAPFFIDKAPGNFLHIGFIKSILPNAKIINTRRHPVANCLAMWKQSFAAAAGFSYDFEDVAQHYCDYISLMEHWDETLPGEVLTVDYEDVVRDTEAQVRRILEYCGLAFEQACLEPHKTQRVIRTASSEQVRQPIYDSAIDDWRHYESHLAPLRAALQPLSDKFNLD